MEGIDLVKKEDFLREIIQSMVSRFFLCCKQPLTILSGIKRKKEMKRSLIDELEKEELRQKLVISNIVKTLYFA